MLAIYYGHLRIRATLSSMLLPVVLFLVAGLSFAADEKTPVPTSYPDEPACKVKSIQKEATAYENAALSPAMDLLAVTQPDSKGIYQLYTGSPDGKNLKCISCVASAGRPRVDRNKPMISWHPSGQWLIVGIEQDKHGSAWMPKSWQRGLLQSGIWLNIWVTTPSGDRWYQLTDYKKSKKEPSDGYVGVSFTPDGRRGVWAEIVDGNIFANHFGKWKLFIADFVVSGDGVPSLANRKEITPSGARWVEPGNFAPNGRQLLLSADIGMPDAQGQDQFVLDVETGEVKNLTSTPNVWDEHGLYSPDGRKVSFMSSYPYRGKSGSNKTASLQTEIMLMDSNGERLQQITHFNEPGYPESQKKKTVAAFGVFAEDGTRMFMAVMSTDFSFGKMNWTVTFEGPCGRSPEGAARRTR